MYQTGYYATGYYQTGYYLPSVVIVAGGIYTYEGLILDARDLLGDNAVAPCPIRYPDTMLLNALNRGLHELSRIRPDAFYDLYSGGGLNVPEITDGIPMPGQRQWEQEFNLELRFYSPLMYYIVSQMDLAEDEYVSGYRHPHGSRAAGGLRLFRTHVLSA